MVLLEDIVCWFPGIAEGGSSQSLCSFAGGVISYKDVDYPSQFSKIPPRKRMRNRRGGGGRSQPRK